VDGDPSTYDTHMRELEFFDMTGSPGRVAYLSGTIIWTCEPINACAPR